MNKYAPPTFSLSLLHPRYWLVWLGFGLLAVVVNILPYVLLRRLGFWLGKTSMGRAQKRVKVVERNLELAFPTMSEDEIDRITEQNFKNTGFALFEMGITWFWPTWRLKRRLRSVNLEELIEYDRQGKGVLLCHPHTLNLEVSARGFAILGYPGCGVYRPHDNPAYEFIQYWGRTHNGNKLINRKDLKQMIRTLNNGERLFYLGDHDYGRNKSVFVPFFAVEEACTTTGANILFQATQCEMMPATGFRDENGHYEINLATSISPQYPEDDATAGAALMNKAYEDVILRQVDQWMWLHRRYKTMKDESQPKGLRYQ